MIAHPTSVSAEDRDHGSGAWSSRDASGSDACGGDGFLKEEEVQDIHRFHRGVDDGVAQVQRVFREI
jgi:hypothetical protein